MTREMPSIMVDDDEAIDWMLQECARDPYYRERSPGLDMRDRCPDCEAKFRRDAKLIIELYHGYLATLGLVSKERPANDPGPKVESL